MVYNTKSDTHKGKKRKTYKSAGDSYTTPPPMSGNFGLPVASNDAVGGNIIQQMLQESSNKLNPGLLALLTGSAGKPMVSANNYIEAVTGPSSNSTPPPQRVAPPTVMEAKPPTAQQSSTDMLTELAMSMLSDPTGATYDYESAMQEAAGGIRQAYGAEIAAIRSNNKAARKGTRQARKEIEHMYNGLSKMLGRQAVKADIKGEKAAQHQLNIAQNSSDYMNNVNTDLAGSEAKMLQDLGLQQAAPDLVSPDFERASKQSNQLVNQGNRAAAYESKMGHANARYMKRSQAGAAYEGVDQSTALLAQLQNYLRGNRDQIGVLKGNQAKEIAASNASIQGQAADQAAASNEETWNRVMDLINQVSDIENTNIDNTLAAQKFRWDQKVDKRKLAQSGAEASDPYAGYPSNIKDALTIVTGSKDPGDQKAVNLLLKLFGTNEYRTGEVSVGNGDTVKLTQAEAMAMARKKGIAAGLQGKELSDFIMAAAASVG